MEILNNNLNLINNFLYAQYLVVLLIFLGVFYSFKLGFVQIRLFRESLKVITEKTDTKDNKEHISSFQALMISTGSRVGIGNIAGIALAVTLGGAGAVFWMWVMAFFGGASSFAESTLAQIYKVKDGEGFKGGPAYYISFALKQKWAASLFAVVIILTYAFGFNGLQSYTMSSSFEIFYNQLNAESGVNFAQSGWTIYIGILLMIFSAYCFFSKSYIIGKVSSIIVPFMVVLYILFAAWAFFTNIDLFPQVISEMFKQAFDFEAIFGGFAGSCVVVGIKRGLFANEAGMGSAPNAAAAAHVSHPVKQGLVQCFAIFLDVIVTTSSAVIVLFSQAYITKMTGANGEILTAMPLVQEAMKEYFGGFGLYFISVAIVLFAITSLIGNYYYAQANIKYLTKSKFAMRIFQILAVLMVFIGANLDLKLAWNLADVLMAAMTTINVIAILFLSKTVKVALDDYLTQIKLDKNPEFHPESLGIQNTQSW
ncbi:MAG: alanine/glycine:cation symporter family protein [Campylobacter hominis]|uniref:alanine/glycine:cation symporter family protein n=1 Tax=Campylobacter TaxID=194 RepID=UPI0023F26F15|nr:MULTISPECIES: alanine/glycine:cation symporter family protein [Campylobacter]MCI6642455.1 alanine:cation symporter family protein [Campylobacter sp.]MDD7423071.1 alanine/glycine:cation symporter family protein [Campylobacter hominis]